MSAVVEEVAPAVAEAPKGIFPPAVFYFVDPHAEKVCYVCNKVGHIAANCPEKDSSEQYTIDLIFIQET